MSGIKLLQHVATSGIVKFGNIQNCMRSIVFTAPIAVNTQNNYLINRCTSRYISYNQHHQRQQQSGNVKRLSSSLNELSLSQYYSPVAYAGTYQQQHRVTQCCFSTKTSPDRAGKSDTKASSAAIAEADLFGDSSKLGLFAKFKLMYKQYWYVLIPVHVVTSIGWLGAFYYLSKSGVDVPALLHNIHLSETIIQKVQNSDMGHYAIAYLCYKVATPLRYAVTLGGTTISIKYLVQMGHIKPIPSKKQIMQMYEQTKANRKAAKAEKDKRPNN